MTQDALIYNFIVNSVFILDYKLQVNNLSVKNKANVEML